MPTVALPGSFDTKSVEYAYLKNLLEAAGLRVHLIDIGVLHDSPMSSDTTAEEVARLGGASLDVVRSPRFGREAALEVMAAGLERVLLALIDAGGCDGVLALGGGSGMYAIAPVFRRLPIGLPKLLVTTSLVGDLTTVVGASDITLMHAVADFGGLNRVSRAVLSNAASAMVGMASARRSQAQHLGETPPTIAVTMRGVTTRGALGIRDLLVAGGFEVMAFHANGQGGRVMETLIDAGLIDGVVDFTLGELTGHKFGGAADAGADRMGAAARRKLPQVIVPGSIELLNFREMQLPNEFAGADRLPVTHIGTYVQVRLDTQEMITMADILADRVVDCDGPVRVLLPLGGLDSLQTDEGPWSDRRGLAEFVGRMRDRLTGIVPLESSSAGINDREFVNQTYEAFIQVWNRARPEQPISIEGNHDNVRKI